MIGIARRAAAPVFTLALFASAALIFTMQPLVGRLVTPMLGGSPAVWNTSMAFFQAALLIGYVYAHLLARLRDLRVQAAIHAAVLMLAWFVLPIHVSDVLGPPDTQRPALWLVGVLALSVGAPFATASATAPLLQAWYARSGRADAGDPYYLYAASNLGSFFGLLAYPLIVEPLVGLSAQTLYWSAGYAVVAALIVASAGIALRTAPIENPSLAQDETHNVAPRWRDRAYWLAAAAVPSALILAVTQHISTDVASAPFLWVAPLALYLLTFVIAFAKRGELVAPIAMLAHPAALAILIISYFSHGDFVWALCANLLAFFVSALVCHQALVRARPSAGRLTEFYFFVSLGGVIGGGLVAFVAPLIFTDIYEYPLALAAVALFRPVRTVYFRTASNALGVASCVMALIALVLLQRQPAEIALFGGGVGAAAALIAAALPAYHGDGEKRQTAFLGIALIFAAGMIFLLFNPDILFTGLGGRDMRIAQPLGGVALISTLVVLAAIVQQSLQMRRDEPAAHAIGTDIAIGIALPVLVLLATLFVAGPRLTHDIVIAIGLGIAAIALFLNRDRPKLLAALILIAFAIVFIDQRSGTRLVHQERSFFGVLRIKEGPASNESGAPLLRILFHGTTIHGAQLEGAHDVERRPLTYYNPGTALGEATLAGLALSENRQLALIGLGTGTTACLTRSNDGLTIFEIDPAVARLSASTTGPFSYVRHCQPKAHIVLGDARLEIAKQRDAAFDVIVVDAFSSDAIPAHLLTREAVALYLRKTSADGIVVLHLSNRNLALVSEAVRVAHSLNAPYLWSVSNRITDNLAGAFAGLPASAMILAHDQETLDALQINRSEWRTLPTPAGRAWSDDYINLPRALWESMSGREECLQFEYKLRCETDGSK